MRVVGAEAKLGRLRRQRSDQLQDSFLRDWSMNGMLAARLLGVKPERLTDTEIPHMMCRSISRRKKPRFYATSVYAQSTPDRRLGRAHWSVPRVGLYLLSRYARNEGRLREQLFPLSSARRLSIAPVLQGAQLSHAHRRARTLKPSPPKPDGM